MLITTLVIILLDFTWVVMLGWRIYQDSNRISKPVIGNLLLGALLSLCTAGDVGTGTWLHALSVASLHYSLFLIYCAVDQLLNNRCWPTTTRKLFLVTTTVVLIGSTLDYLGRCSLDAFIYDASFPASRLCYVTYHLNTGFRLTLLTFILLLYWRNLTQHSDPVYFIRRLICMLGFFIMTCRFFATEIMLIAVPFHDHLTRALLRQIYVIDLPLSLILLTIGFSIPGRLLSRLAAPISNYISKRRQQEHELLCYLHRKIVQVVPDVQLPYTQVRDLRVLVEISDARQIIWSQEQVSGVMEPSTEAEHLFTLLEHGSVLHEPGIYPPPAVVHGTITQHYLAVAKHLKRLEQRSSTQSHKRDGLAEVSST